MKVINRQARFDYDVKERIEAGIILTGSETKSAKAGAVDLSHAFCKINGGQAMVYNLHIYPYKFANNTDYQPSQPRKLLLNHKEIIAIQTRMKQGRLLLVPTEMYTKHRLVKLELGLARGKRIYEKREAIKKRDLEREMSS